MNFQKTQEISVCNKSFFVEKVIFPSEILTFDAPKGSRVEIWGNDLSGLHLEESVIVGET